MVDWKAIEKKWQKKWQKEGIGKAVNSKKDKFSMIFAYPGISGYPHVGHMRGYSYTDMICRYQRMKGKEVFFPVGTHASGNQAIAFANKVKNNDEKWIGYLKDNGCSAAKIKTLDTPEKIISYFNKVYVNDYWKKFGFICDWDRFTCTTYPDYEKFMQWQFRKLREKNLLIQKPYFATACVEHGPVAVDPSETDISKGGNAEKNEYTLLKFAIDLGKGKEFLVAATLRPETIYGQTNLWVNPNAQYVRVNVEGERWIMSKEAADKLTYQKDDVVLLEDIDVADLMGKKALATGIDRKIIILPAVFCDPKVGSGIVTSVPSDAPYDYVALQTVKKDKSLLRKYNVDVSEVEGLNLIPIIKSKGYGEFPAQEIVAKRRIESLDDPKLEEATKEIYKAGFHSGIMRDNCGKYAGKSVAEAKELVKTDLLEKGKADVFHDLSEEVLCRCGKQVLIKRIDDQWFIRYSDPELTEKSKQHVSQMKVFPKEYGEHLPAVLDWFSDRACARLGNWSGSKFPFDEKWTIEPISDSTLYPAYYIVAKFVNDGTLKVKDLTEEFFDYVFLGKEELSGVPEKMQEKWKLVKEEFDYFYPLDINLGGKEHKTVHFPVFLMNHVGILPAEKWPKGIFVNWWVTGKGSKISKSKGGAQPIPEAIEKYGVDAMRLYYAHIGSPHVDVVWDENVVLNYKNALERIWGLVNELNELSGGKKLIDNWLLSRVHQHLRSVEKFMKEYNLRDLASIVYYGVHEDLKWYIRRGGENKSVIAEVVSIWSKLMNPITPHLSEELNEELVSISDWPNYEEEKINLSADAGEELIRSTVSSMRNVMRLAKVEKPQKFTLYVASPWLYDVYTILAHQIKVTRNMGEILREILKHDELKIKGKEISKIVAGVLKDVSRLPSVVTSEQAEYEVLMDAKNFLEKEFDCSVDVELAKESGNEKAANSRPGKVGMVVE